MERLTTGPWAGSYAFTAETLERLPEFHAEIIGQPLLHPTISENWRAMQQRFAGPLLARLPLADLPAPLLALVLGTPLWKTLPALGLLAGVGGIALALALAAQSTVETLFGGISIFADRPFRVGDTIQGGSVSGTVEAVGPRSSRIRGADGTLTTVPNSDLAKMHITNMSARSGFLFRHTIRLGGEATRAQAEWLLAALRERVAVEPRVTQEPPPRVRLIGFGEASLDLEVFAKVPVATQAEFLDVQEGLILEIMRAVETGGLRLAMAPQPIASQPAEAPATAH